MGRDGSGVTVRDGSIRISFAWPPGTPRRETLKADGVVLKPTPSNVKLAHRVKRDVDASIQAGTFDYAAFFPHSKHAPKAGGLTFGKACDEWLASKGRLAEKTKDQYRNALEVWKRMFGADTPLSTMRHASMAAKIGAHPWASAKLMNNYLIALRGVFKLHARDLKLDDPTVGIENGRHQKPGPDPLTAAERERVLADLRKHYDPRIYAYFLFAFVTGMRPEEQIALRWGKIDWHLKTALVDTARTKGKDGPIKTYAVRDVELVDRALEALRIMKPHTFMLGDDGEVFQNPVTRRAWHDERSQRDHYWKPALRRCGIRARRAYCTRHTYATTGLMSGIVPPAYLARQMGHKGAKMFFEVYAKWIDRADADRGRAALNAAMGGAGDAGIAQESGKASEG